MYTGKSVYEEIGAITAIGIWRGGKEEKKKKASIRK